MHFSTEKSRQIYERTLGVLIEASSSSSRGPANFGKYPIFMERARGSRIFDVDGNEYIDWMMAFGALPLGHAHPEIVEAITEAAISGAHFATATPVELEVADMLQGMVRNAERVRFANTGTEAMMAAIRLARGVTGRPKILKFEGHYHGWHDDVLVSSNVLPPEPLKIIRGRLRPSSQRELWRTSASFPRPQDIFKACRNSPVATAFFSFLTRLLPDFASLPEAARNFINFLPTL